MMVIYMKDKRLKNSMLDMLARYLKFSGVMVYNGLIYN